MNSELHQCVSSGDYNTFLSLINTNPFLLNQTTVQKNTVLHVASAFNQKIIAEEITQRQPSILYTTNLKEDTALHLAARLGSYEVVEYLAKWRDNDNDNNNDLEADDRNKELLKMENFKKDTALHDAIRNSHGEIAKLLVKECPELVEYANEVGESPLFLAVEQDYLDIAEEILKVNSNCLYGGRGGTNVLHAIILRTLKRYKQSLIGTPVRVCFGLLHICCNAFTPAAYRERKIIDFIEKMLNKFPNILIEPDIQGWLPLHYAAYVGSDEFVKLILEHKPSVAYKKEKNGLSALHLAAKEGRTAVLQTFTRLCPDSCEILDSNDQTALHIAVANRRAYVVRKMLELESFWNLVNQQDKDGNTPLHLAAIVGDCRIFQMLSVNGRVDKKIINNEWLTINDIIRLNPRFRWHHKVSILSRLELNGALRGMEYVLARKTESNLFLEKYNKKSIVEEQKMNLLFEKYEKKSDVKEQETSGTNESEFNLVVATMIATVTFSAAFQIPGGYQNDGIAVLRHNRSFRLYMIFNAWSFGFAVASMCISFFTRKLAILGFSFPKKLSILLTAISLLFMVLAFLCGTTAVMAENSGFSQLVQAVAALSFVVPVCFFELVLIIGAAFFFF